MQATARIPIYFPTGGLLKLKQDC